MSKTAYIGIGSNLGDKLANCRTAIERVAQLSEYRIRAKSGFFLTEPVGVEGQDWYLNGVFSISTDAPADQLLKTLQSIETGLGRVKVKKWDPRILDLDILLFGQDVIDEKGLTIPHPRMHLRRFVLAPMVQLAPGLIHPVLGKTMTELLDNLAEEGQTVIPLEET